MKVYLLYCITLGSVNQTGSSNHCNTMSGQQLTVTRGKVTLGGGRATVPSPVPEVVTLEDRDIITTKKTQSTKNEPDLQVIVLLDRPFL